MRQSPPHRYTAKFLTDLNEQGSPAAAAFTNQGEPGQASSLDSSCHEFLGIYKV